MPKKSKLTPEQWNDLADFYKEGHTVHECGRVWGLSAGYISVKLKQMGVKMRAAFEPSRPEKYERAPTYIQERMAPPVVGGAAPSESCPRETSSKVTAAPPAKRKIISLDGSEGPVLYEGDNSK